MNLALICGIPVLLIVALILYVVFTTVDCPTCHGTGRVWYILPSVDYICPTCKGTRTVSRFSIKKETKR